MSVLADKIRRARESQVEACGHTFTIRRPTDADAMSLGESTALDLVRRFTVGWNLTELDLIPGGSGAAVDFDAEAFGEWVADQPEVIGGLITALFDAYKAHAAKREGAAKN